MSIARPLLLCGLILLIGACGCRRSRGTAYEGYAFVAAAGSRSLAVVDLASFSVVRQIRLGSAPVQVVSDPGRRALYVMGEGGPAGVTLVDTARLELRRSAWLADKPRQIRLSASGDRLYALDSQAHLLRSLDPETLGQQRQMRLAGAPVDFDLSADGRRACVSLASGELEILDLENWRSLSRVRLGGEPAQVAIRQDGRAVFVANRATRSLSIVEPALGRLIAHLPLETRPEALRFKPDGGELFVSGGDGGRVVIVSAYRNEVDPPLLAGAEPRDIAITQDNRLLFVANSAANTVSVMDIAQRRVLASVPVGAEPHRIALTLDDQYALVLNRRSGDMAVIRAAAIEPRRQPLFTMIPVGSQPVDLAVQAR